ncbi:MAG: TetR/AcrR family transcriptional regulator [Nitrospiria bacterium]
MDNGSTAFKIMGVASELIQTHGYHAFSYRDLSERVGIKTSSIHYHFPTKVDLAKAVIQHCYQVFLKKLNAFGEEDSAANMLRAYAGSFIETFRQGKRICPCASLASDLNGLPDEVRVEMRLFVDAHEKWLSAVLQRGMVHGEFRRLDDVGQTARNIFYTLEGALLIARTSSVERIEDAASYILSELRPVHRP